jgi:cytochrome b6-f complex iron-sulfur subunit
MADEKDAAAGATPPGAKPPAGPPPPQPAAPAAPPANPAQRTVTPAAAAPPVGSPPMTPLVPEKGATPGALPYGRSNTIGPGIAASTTAKAPASAEGEGLSRRGFMKWSLPVGWVAFSAACASSLVATARFLFPNVLFEPPQSFKAGFPGEYNVGEVDVRWKDAYGVWIVRNAEGFYALIAVCTHLGCSPNWLPAENKFKCPCHGSGFYMTGVNFEGPAPRPLERARIVLADDGQILVDKSVKFQSEKGEWTKPEAFLKV